MRLAARAGTWVTLALLGCVAAPAWSQTVDFRPGERGMPMAEQVVSRVLERDRYVVIVRDTVLAAGSVIDRDVVILGATLRVEGRIAGDLVAVQSDVFTRPGGRIEGTVAVLAGGFYGSSLARLHAPPIDASNYRYRVERLDEGRYRILGPADGNRVRLAGLYGFLPPAYDRVNAISLVWGLDVDPRAAWAPDLAGRVRYRSAREFPDGELEATWRRGRHTLWVRGGRGVRSNDAWIMGDLANSVSSLVGGADHRNYYDPRFVEAELAVRHGTDARWSHGLKIGFERAGSLANQDPFSIFSYRDGFQPNLPVEPGDIVSLELSSSVTVWFTPESSLTLKGSGELAESDVAGDFTFTLLRGGAELGIDAPGPGRLSVLARAQAPGSTAAPRQRWGALGGWRTLPTLDRLARSGDRMWWTELTYTLPTGERVDLLGRLGLWASYAAGNAWTDDARPPTVHDIGLGISLGRIALGLYSDAGDDFDTEVAVGIQRAY